MVCDDGKDLRRAIFKDWEGESNQTSIFDVCVCVDRRFRSSVVVFYDPFCSSIMFDYTNYPDMIVLNCKVVQRSTEYIEPTEVAQSLHRIV
jgi:hypothetical protein